MTKNYMGYKIRPSPGVTSSRDCDKDLTRHVLDGRKEQARDSNISWLGMCGAEIVQYDSSQITINIV